MAQAIFDEHPLGDYLRGLYFPMRYSSIINIYLLAEYGEMPLLIPGTYPVSEQELIALDEHSDGDHKEWLPGILVDFIEVSYLLHFVLSPHTGIFAHTIPYKIAVVFD